VINNKMRKIIFISIVIITSISSLNAQTTDKEIKFGGRIMYDMATWGSDDFENAGSEFRRVRLFSSGTIYENVKYKLQLDFANGDIAFKDVFIEINKLPIQGDIRIGYFKEPFRLESLTSSKYITFMERGLPIAMSVERNSGVMYHNTFGERLSLQTGVFLNADDFGNDKTVNSAMNATSRLTYLAINSEEKLLHLGIAGSIRNSSSSGGYNVSTRAENHLGTKLLAYENYDNDAILLAYETSYVNKSFSIQGEYVQSEIGNNDFLSSYYGQVSYFITGESRTYKNSLSGFGRVKPINNYGENSWGAFEIAARVSQMDFSSVENGTLDDITLGLNWYLNPNTRVMMNYVMGEMTNYQGEITKENAIMMRVQIDF
jgi:phosphate-selective porin OprO and OprP